MSPMQLSIVKDAQDGKWTINLHHELSWRTNVEYVSRRSRVGMTPWLELSIAMYLEGGRRLGDEERGLETSFVAGC